MRKLKTDIDQWKAELLLVKSDELPPISVPFHVLLGEAVDVARFCTTYWKPEVDGDVVVRRGLMSAAGKKSRLRAGIAEEILSLQRAAQEAQTEYLLTVDPGSGVNALERGRFLLDELTSTLEWHFDDGVQDENDVKLANLESAHADDPNTADALASALDDYVALAVPHRAELDGLGGFEAAFIDEARTVATTLREKPATPTVVSDAARRALTRRNKLVTLLVDRVGIVRAAARFVFRGQPEIARQSTSAYERRRRAAARRAQAKKATPPAAPAPAVQAPAKVTG